MSQAVPTEPTLAGAPSRELIELLIELATGLQKRAMYPEGHPMLLATVDRLLARLMAFLGDRPALAIGVGRSQLLVDGTATDPDHLLGAYSSTLAVVGMDQFESLSANQIRWLGRAKNLGRRTIGDEDNSRLVDPDRFLAELDHLSIKSVAGTAQGLSSLALLDFRAELFCSGRYT